MIEKIEPHRLRAVAAAALIAIGGGFGYWLLSQRSSEDLPAGAKIVPQEALMAVSVSSDPKQWQQLQQYGTPKSQELLRQGLAALNDRVLEDYGYDYQEEIQPWIDDEVTIAFLPPPTEPRPDAPPLVPGEPQETVVVLPIGKGNLAKQLFEKSASSQEGTERTYKGVSIRDRELASEQIYSTAIIDKRFVVVTTRPDTLDRVIDAYKGGDSMASAPGYKRAWEPIVASNPFARLYVNVPRAIEVLSNNSTQPIQSGVLAKVENQGLATTIALQPEGILFKSLSWLKSNSESQYLVANKAQSMTDRLPIDTVMAISGSNLEQLWKDYLRGAEANPLAPSDPNWLRKALKSTVDLDLEKDLLPWMTGEFALGAIRAGKEANENFPGGLVLMVEVSDRKAAEEIFAKLDKTIAEKYNYKVEEAEVRDRPVVNWASPFGGLTATHGWLSGNVAFITIGAPIADLLLPQPSYSLGDTDRFQEAVPLELEPNNGHFFWDFESTINAESFDLLQLPPEQEAFVSAIRSIGVTGAIQDKRKTRYDLLIKLKKTGG